MACWIGRVSQLNSLHFKAQLSVSSFVVKVTAAALFPRSGSVCGLCACLVHNVTPYEKQPSITAAECCVNVTGSS